MIKTQSQDDPQYYNDQFYQTQYELIKSRKLADQVATALNLAQTDFVDRHPSTLLDSLLGRGATSNSAPLFAEEIRQRHEQAVDKIMGGLSVQPVLNSAIVRVRIHRHKPGHSASASALLSNLKR